MDRHTKVAIDAMEEAIQRAQIRDSWRERALRNAIAAALVAPAVLVDPATDFEHREKLRAVMHDVRALANDVDGIPVDDFCEPINRLAEEQIAYFGAEEYQRLATRFAAAPGQEVLRRIVERYGAHFRRDEDFYAAAAALGMEVEA